MYIYLNNILFEIDLLVVTIFCYFCKTPHILKELYMYVYMSTIPTPSCKLKYIIHMFNMTLGGDIKDFHI